MGGEIEIGVVVFVVTGPVVVVGIIVAVLVFVVVGGTVVVVADGIVDGQLLDRALTTRFAYVEIILKFCGAKASAVEVATFTKALET